MGILRLALALCVFAAHSQSFKIPFLKGDIAVEIFFVMSGFYMQLILGNFYTFSKMGDNWIKKFYINRYLRIFPTYFIVGITTLILAGLKQLLFSEALVAPFNVIAEVSQLQNSFSNVILKVFLLFTNLGIFFQDFIMFIGVNQGNAELVNDFLNSDIQVWQGLAIPQAWSLGVELNKFNKVEKKNTNIEIGIPKTAINYDDVFLLERFISRLPEEQLKDLGDLESALKYHQKNLDNYN